MALRYVPIKLLLLILSFSVCADNHLWTLDTTKPASAAPADDSTTNASLHKQLQAEGQLLQPDLAQIDQLQAGDRILLPLPEGVAEAVVEQIQTHSAQSYSVLARIQHGTEQLPVVITRGRHGFFGRIVSPSHTYVIRGDITNSRLLIERDLSNQLDFSKPDGLAPKPDPTKATSAKPAPAHTEQLPAAIQNETFPPLTDQSIAVIDVLMIYSPQAAAIYNGDIATRLNHLIAVSNQIYRDSGVFVEMRVAQMKQVSMLATESSKQLDEVTYKEQAFADLEQWRFEAGADMVALFTPMTSTSVCGLGWYATNRDSLGQISYRADYMVSLTHITCGDYVLAHEAGHNMGLAHSEQQGDTGWSFPFARGYGINQTFATVMAYASAFNAPHIYKFSNPQLQCNGHPCGVERHDPHGADASYAINAVRHGLAKLYNPNSNVTFEQAVANVTDAGLRTCLSEIKIAKPELKYAGQLTELGTYNFNYNCGNALHKISSLAGLEQFTELKKIYLSMHQISDFSVLGQLQQLSQITLSGTQSINLSWLENLPVLSHLTLYNFTLNDVTPIGNVQTLRDLNFTNTSVTSFDPLRTLSQLRQLTIDPSQASTDKLSSSNWFSGLTNLIRLQLPDSKLSQLTGLSGLSELDSLTIGSTESLNVSALQGLTQLRTLDLAANPRLDCSSSYQVWRALPKLSNLQLPTHCRSNDVERPVIPALQTIVVEAKATLTPVQLTAPIAQDNADGSIVAVTNNEGPFSVGTHQIEWRATDYHGNVAQAWQTLTVRDTTAPELTGPQHAQVSAWSTQGAYRYTSEIQLFFQQYQAVDLVTKNITISYPTPEYWQLGVNEVLLQAADGSGNSTQRTVLMVVNYEKGPQLTAPPTLTLAAPGPAGLPASDARVQQFIAEVRAKDYWNEQQLPVQSKVPSPLMPGKNLLVFSATDSRGVTSNLIAEIILSDLTAPSLKIPATLKLTGNSSGIAGTDLRIRQFLQSVTASDNFDAELQISHNAPEQFLPGITTIRFTVTDSNGNSASADGYIEVLVNKRKNKVLKMLLMVPRT